MRFSLSLVRRTLMPLAAGLIMAACSSPPSLETGANVAPLYSSPATYADHRAQQQTFEIDGKKIAYTDHGSGPTIVLLHGVPTSSWMFRKVIPGLQNELRVISVDLLGYGSSDKPDEGPAYADAAQAARVNALLTHLGVEQYALLMHDMGGLVAWELMRDHPGAVSHAIVLNTIIGDEGFNQPNMEPGMMTRQLMNAYSSSLTSVAVLTKTFNDLGLTGEHELTEDECYGYVLPMREGADPALYAFFTHINDELFVELDEKWAALKGWDGDAMVMWGAKDKTLTVGQIPMLQAAFAIPDDQIFVYPENAHFLAEEIPEEVIRNVTAFVTGS